MPGRSSSMRLAKALAVLFAAGCADASNIVTDFSSGSNPNGVWSYYYGTSSTAQTAYTTAQGYSSCSGFGLPCWYNGGSIPDSLDIVQNISGAPRNNGTIVIPNNALSLDPEAYSVSVVFTASSAGTYNIGGNFIGDDTVGNSHPVVILLDGTAIYSNTIATYGQDDGFDLSRTLAVGDTVSFYVGTGSAGCSYCFLSTALNATVTQATTTPSPMPEPASLGLLSIAAIALGTMTAATRRSQGRRPARKVKQMTALRFCFTFAKLGGVCASLSMPVLQGSTINLPIAGSLAMITTTDQATTYCSVNGSPANCSYGGASSGAQISNGGSAQASAGTNSNLAASSSTLYAIAVTGPSATVVPIIISGTTSVQDASTSSFAISFISLIDTNLSNTSVLSQYFSSPVGCSTLLASAPSLACASPGEYSFDASLTPGDIYMVELTAGAAGGENASALIDPSIMIDPSFADADQYTLIASPGVFSSTSSPASASPEPKSLTLLGFGFASIAWGAFRKTKP